MDVFKLRNQLITDYDSFVRSFIRIRDKRISDHVHTEMDKGLLWPDPLIQLNPTFEPGETIDELVARGTLHDECQRIFRIKSTNPTDPGIPLRLHRHQAAAVKVAREGRNYVLTTGTGSGKSLAYIIPIVDHVLRQGSGRGIRAIVVYPMNALANSQVGELGKFLCGGYPDACAPVTFKKYTGQESAEERDQILNKPPDILLTNYVMLELILTRFIEKRLVRAAQGLRFLVLDELHTYRGRQGADVSMLVRRVRESLSASQLQCIGTSATLAGAGSWNEQQTEVAEASSMLFGTEVRPEDVIGETLRRATPELDVSIPAFVAKLKERVGNSERKPPSNHGGFVEDPLSIWIESAFGITTELKSGRLVRQRPRPISGSGGAARELSELVGVPEDRCAAAIEEHLLAGYQCKNPTTGFPVFAFRLNQFLSRGDTVYASLEEEDERYLTVHGQQYVPNDRQRVLLPLVFCRECGQEYYCVCKRQDAKSKKMVFAARELSERIPSEEGESGFLHISTTPAWPEDEAEQISRLPDDWIEERNGVTRVRQNRRAYRPLALQVNTNGEIGGDGIRCWYVGAPFRFCMNCGASYDFRQNSDFQKLGYLGTEGRSTATTLLSLSAILHLREYASISPEARKLLSFTDNRQDASLQAGHFNDFVEVGLLRSALYRAMKASGDAGLRHDELPQRVFEVLGLPFKDYASNPEVRFQAESETKRALRDVLGYRLYRDLKRGWRITAPNLEQCGLLEIDYLSLDDVCKAEDLWQNCHAALASATPETRKVAARVLLDFMRHETAIKVDYLDAGFQERLQLQSSQRLIPPWALDENERLEHATVLYPRSKQEDDYRGNTYLSARGGFGQYLRRGRTFPDCSRKINLDDAQVIIQQLLGVLSKADLVQVVNEPRDGEDVAGYQLMAAAMIWKAGDGHRVYRDPIRRPNEPSEGSFPNPFFVEFYQSMANQLVGLEAREHTAQVKYELREEREKQFRSGKLPILYCSPTMELGIDIATLNVVNMRNVPPTPANYAQRSGRAGRSGQPALVFTYCAGGSPHDQYFYRRPQMMVGGAVLPPNIDLANEDLVRAHIHAIWLAEAGLDLGKSLQSVLDLAGDNPTLALLPSIKDTLDNASMAEKALHRAKQVLATVQADLAVADWYHDGWIEDVLNQRRLSFEQACERWRGLHRSALRQAQEQTRIIHDASRSREDKEQAERLRREAEAQLRLLVESDSNVLQSDFYSYRYFASEGFLPGYNFPRLPLSAFIPGRKIKGDRDEFLQRPRFLAISEFGPRAFIYHEGSRYIINKAILPVGEQETLLTSVAKLCPNCGYLHPVAKGNGPDLCERCKHPLGPPMRQLFRLQNVVAKRRDKINCDEEERLRLGYELRTVVRFVERAGQPSYRNAVIECEGRKLGMLWYGNAATLWRINLGWRRRANKDQQGFVLDIERGYWSKNEEMEDPDDADPMSAKQMRVIPYVEDHKNCLLFEPAAGADEKVMASLQAALKNAIQIRYELEENELAAEPLPSYDERRLILLYEAAEGGAGVLRRLVDDAHAFAEVAKEALDLCHFYPETGEDLRRSPGSKEDCEAACYDCLMSYSNQYDHERLDRKLISAQLMDFARSEVKSSPTQLPRAEHLKILMARAESSLEREWLQFLEREKHRLPSASQKFVEACKTRPDFLYEEHNAAIYIDGPVHDYPDRQNRDREQTDSMEDQGYTVIRFSYQDAWAQIVEKYPEVFGRPA